MMGNASERARPRERPSGSSAAASAPESDAFAGVLAAAQAGDERAAAALFSDLHPRLSRYMRAAEPRFADDLTCEVWEAIARGLGSFIGSNSDFRAWAFTIARRRLIEHHRRTSRRRTDPVDQAFFFDLPGIEAPEIEVIEQMSTEDAVSLVVAALSPDQSEVVLLRVLADLTAAQVAAIVGRPESWVRVTQHRAIRKLADRLTAKTDVTR